MTEPPASTRISNISVATIAGAAGCFMTVAIVGALVLGIVIDKLLGFRGPFTVGLVLVSAPVSLYVVTRMVLSLIKRTQAQSKPQDTDTSF
jgi:sugar phosphate permease